MGPFSDYLPDEVLQPKLEAVRDLMERDQFSKAIALLNDIIKLAPDYAVGWACRGDAHLAVGKFPEAIADLSKAVKLKPMARSYFNLALAYLRSRQPGEALAALQRVTQLEPNDKEARSMRQQIAAKMGLADLDRIAGIVEHFMYSRCGPGQHWSVELRNMYRFRPDDVAEEYVAVILDLFQQPPALIQVQARSEGYEVNIIRLQSFPECPDVPTWVEPVTKVVPAEDAALLGVLNGFIEQGILTRHAGCLRYEDKAQPPGASE